MTSSAWPWMLNEEEDTYLNPVMDDNDSRPLVCELILKHRSSIDQMTLAMAEHALYEPEKHDDLWMLRFWLSFQKEGLKYAIDAAQRTLEFRQELGLDQWDLRFCAPTDCEAGTMVQEYLCHWQKDAVHFVAPDEEDTSSDSVPRVFFKLSSMEQHKIVLLREDFWMAFYGHCSEWIFQWSDYITRKTGRLTQGICQIDAQGIALGYFHSECNRRNGRVMTILQDFYPQTLQTINVCNTPPVFRFAWNMMLKVVVPQRLASLVDLIQPGSKRSASSLDRSGSSRHASIVMTDNSISSRLLSDDSEDSMAW